MRTSIGQILLLLIISFLLFGDFYNFKNKLTNVFKHLNKLVNDKNRKKGT